VDCFDCAGAKAICNTGYVKLSEHGYGFASGGKLGSTVQVDRLGVEAKFGLYECAGFEIGALLKR